MLNSINSIISTELLLPKQERQFSSSPFVSIVVPSLNEQITIGEFIDWCFDGLRSANVEGEVIIVDSSSDETAAIALSKGARVLRTPKRGLGHAYLDCIPYIRGEYVIMGDCDLTYDFRELKPFVDKFKQGYDFVMGSRFLGSIEEGAMPGLHRYFGTPLTTWILNKIYHSKYSDIHCGMRGLSKECLVKLNLTSTSWEYASEMVLKAARLKLKIAEVPVSFYKDREGRVSHHRRMGFLSPWVAGWLNLRVMLSYSPDTFLIYPGIITLILGLTLFILSIPGSIRIGSVGFNLYMLLLGMTFVVLGFSVFQVGVLARNIHQLRYGLEKVVLLKLTYDKGMLLSGILLCIGLVIEIPFLINYILNGFVLHSLSHIPIVGLFFILISVQIFTFTLLLEMGRRHGWQSS